MRYVSPAVWTMSYLYAEGNPCPANGGKVTEDAGE
jgi:hypothetical protein